MNMAKVARERSNCLRMSVGAVLVKDKRVITTGYNGAPIGVKDCIDGGCKRCLERDRNKLKPSQNKELCICLHAEQNTILQSAYHGSSARGATLYSTIEPCVQCAKILINAGVKEVVYGQTHYDKSHEDNLGKKLLKSAKVKVRKI